MTALRRKDREEKRSHQVENTILQLQYFKTMETGRGINQQSSVSGRCGTMARRDLAPQTQGAHATSGHPGTRHLSPPSALALRVAPPVWTAASPGAMCVLLLDA